MVSQNGHDDGPRTGALLRASRLRCGEEAADVARVLHIRLVYIEAIEEGRYDDLPGAAYAIGFIRAYADHLGLDSGEVVRRFKAETSGLDMSIELKFLSPIPERGIPRGAILFVGMVVAVLAYGGWYVSSTRDLVLTDLIPPLPERLAALLPIAAGTDAQDPAAPPDRGAAPRGDAAGATPAMPEEAKPMAAPQPVAASAELGQADGAVETAPSADAPTLIEVPPITVTPTPEVAETAETTPLEETPAADLVTASGANPEPERVAQMMAQMMAQTVAQTVAEITASMPPPATEPGAEPAAGEMSSARDETEPVPVAAITDAPEGATPATAPTALEAVADVRPPAPTPPQPAAPETLASPATAGGTETPGPASSAAGDAGTTAEAPPPEAAGGDGGDQVAALTEDAGRRPADDAAMPADDTAMPDDDAVTPAEGRQSRILVRARMASWIQVRDDIGNQLLTTRLMRAGDTFRVPDRPGLTLLTGNAGALEILVDGETVPPLGPIGAVRRDVTLDIERLREGTAAIE